MFTGIVEETGKVQTITGSKTVIKCHEDLEKTKASDLVNIEIDIPAKYIEKFLSTSDNRSRIDIDFLQRNGFC